MEYYAIPMSTTSTAKVPVMLNEADDWWNWDPYIIGLARSRGVLNILLGKEPYPTEPIRPAYPTGAPANRQAQGEGQATGNERNYAAANEEAQQPRENDLTEPSAAQMMLYKQQLELYKEEKEQNRLKQAGLAAIDENDNEVEIYQKLRDKLKPSLEDRMLRIQERYSKLGSKPVNQSMEKWLGEWEDVISACVRLKMDQYTGYLGTQNFLMALRKMEPVYAEIRLNELKKDHSINVFDEINDYRKRWESKSQKEQNAIFATFKGQSSDQRNSGST